MMMIVVMMHKDDGDDDDDLIEGGKRRSRGRVWQSGVVKVSGVEWGKKGRGLKERRG